MTTTSMKGAAIGSARLAAGRERVATGTVKSYDKRGGYGFIEPDGGGGEVLVSFRELVRAGLGPPSVGERVEFRLATDSRVRKATDVAPLGTAESL